MREVLRCLYCELNQFRAANDRCRKCHATYVMPPPVAPTGLNVGMAVRIIRSMRRWRQRDLAEKLDKPRTWITKIENGNIAPTVDSVQRLADALNVNIQDLLSLEAAREVWLRELGPYVISLNKQQRETVMLMARKLAA